MDLSKMSDATLRARKVSLGFKILKSKRQLRSMIANLNDIQIEMTRRGLMGRMTTDYKAKYEKCIDVIRRFDPGIIGMYDL